MITITAIVKELIEEDETAFEALRRRLLNCNAYARQIHKKVEAKRMETVKTETIASVLRRLEGELKDCPPLIPHIPINNISIKSPLSELTYSVNDFDFKVLEKITRKFKNAEDFISITQGNREITIICSPNIFEALKKAMPQEPNFIFKNLGAVSAQFPVEFYPEPNLVYSMISQVAKKHIDIIELISTYTEIIFIVKEEELSQTFEQLRKIQN